MFYIKRLLTNIGYLMTFETAEVKPNILMQEHKILAKDHNNEIEKSELSMSFVTGILFLCLGSGIIYQSSKH